MKPILDEIHILITYKSPLSPQTFIHQLKLLLLVTMEIIVDEIHIVNRVLNLFIDHEDSSICLNYCYPPAWTGIIHQLRLLS
jgi:hypothetical protein